MVLGLELAAVSVIVVIASGDADRDGSSEAIERALENALAERATVVVRRSPPGSTTASAETAGAALARERERDGDTALVAVVTWAEKQRHVTLRVVDRATGRATDREIRFDPSDAPPERGRTVGFALASMVPEEALGERPRGASEPPPPPPPATIAVPPADGSAGAERAASPPLPPPPNAFAIDVTGLGAIGVAGYGGGAGGSVAARLPLSGSLSTRLAFAGRVGEIGPAKATSRTLALGAGIAWHAWLTSSRAWSLGARADLLLLHQEVTHFSADDPEPASRGRFLPGADVLVETSIRLIDHAMFVAAVGPEVAFGTTGLVVAGQDVGVVPPLRLCAEAGLRVSF